MTPNTKATLDAALAKCSGGEEIELGDFATPLAIDGRKFNFAKPVKLVGGSVRLTRVNNPADAKDPAPFIALEGGGAIKATETHIVFNIGWGAKNFTVEGTKVSGLLAMKAVDPSWGYGAETLGRYGIGVGVRTAQNIVMRKIEISDVWRGASASESRNVLFEDFDIHGAQSDGITMGGMVDFDIVRPQIWDFNPIVSATGQGDHCDAIQGWSVGLPDDLAGVRIVDPLIRGYLPPDGNPFPPRRPQGIFLSDSRHGGHRGVEIIRPVVLNPIWHGITALQCIDPLIEGAVVMTEREAGTNPARPWIKVSAGRIANSKAMQFGSQSGVVPPPSCEKLDFVSAAEIEAAHVGWRAQFRGPSRADLLALITGHVKSAADALAQLQTLR